MSAYAFTAFAMKPLNKNYLSSEVTLISVHLCAIKILLDPLHGVSVNTLLWKASESATSLSKQHKGQGAVQTGGGIAPKLWRSIDHGWNVLYYNLGKFLLHKTSLSYKSIQIKRVWHHCRPDERRASRVLIRDSTRTPILTLNELQRSVIHSSEYFYKTLYFSLFEKCIHHTKCSENVFLQ